MRTGRIIAAALALAVAGCETYNLAPANPQAQAVGTPVLHYVLGVPGAPMKITMPSGETLPGSAYVDEQAASGTPNFHASARGPQTRMTCEGRLAAGHGTADCRDQNGAAYRLTM